MSFKASVALLEPPFAPHAVDRNGLKAIWIVHVPPGRVLCPTQPSPPLAITKSPEFAPDGETDVMVSAPANGPELLFVTTIG